MQITVEKISVLWYTISVSHTHLHVYKRQAEMNPACVKGVGNLRFPSLP